MFVPKKLYQVILIMPKKYSEEFLLNIGNEKIIQIEEFNEKYRQIPSIDSPNIRTHETVKDLMRLDYIIGKLKICNNES